MDLPCLLHVSRCTVQLVLHRTRCNKQRRAHAQVHGSMLTGVELELLLDLAGAAVPDDGGLVHGARQQQVALLVPLEREDGPSVVVQRVLQLACAPRTSCTAVTSPTDSPHAKGVKLGLNSQFPCSSAAWLLSWDLLIARPTVRSSLTPHTALACECQPAAYMNQQKRPNQTYTFYGQDAGSQLSLYHWMV